MNKAITIYDLLRLVKDGQAPKTILYSHIPYQLKHGEYVSCDGEDDYLFSGINIVDILNDTVEIIEEDEKIDKIKSLNNVGNSSDLGEFKDKQQINNHILKDKINKLIDKVNKLEGNEN